MSWIQPVKQQYATSLLAVTRLMSNPNPGRHRWCVEEYWSGGLPTRKTKETGPYISARFSRRAHVTAIIKRHLSSTLNSCSCGCSPSSPCAGSPAESESTHRSFLATNIFVDFKVVFAICYLFAYLDLLLAVRVSVLFVVSVISMLITVTVRISTRITGALAGNLWLISYHLMDLN